MRASVPYDPGTMQILENGKHTSPSGISLGCIRPARVSAKVVIGGEVGIGRRRAEWRLVRGSRELTVVMGVTVASGAANCTDYCDVFGMLLSFGERFRESIDGADISMVEALGMGYSKGVL